MAKLAYILSASHSGSTLLAMLLGAHPDVVSVGELKATDFGDPQRYRCSCGALVRECEFWRRVGNAMAARGLAFDVTEARTNILELDCPYARRLLRPLHRGPLVEALRDRALKLSGTWRRHLEATQARNLALIETLESLTGARVVVDSSKIGLRLKYLLRIPSLDVRVIRLIRDGRAVALTYINPRDFADAKRVERRGGGSGCVDSEGAARGADMRSAAREWRRSNEEAEVLVAGLPRAKWLEVRYENLCQDPDAVLRAICSFVGIDPDAIVLDFRSVAHHVVGNGMRFDTTSTVSLDERWRTQLTSDQLRVFDSIAGEVNRRYGYQL